MRKILDAFAGPYRGFYIGLIGFLIANIGYYLTDLWGAAFSIGRMLVGIGIVIGFGGLIFTYLIADEKWKNRSRNRSEVE